MCLARNQKLTKSDVIIWAGVLIGVADWVTDLAYAGNVKLASEALRSACITFVILQPTWYIFMLIVYIASHEELDNVKDRRTKMLLAFPYAILQQLKLMAAGTPFNDCIYNRFKRRDQFLLFNMENSYRIQLVVEFLF